MNFNQQLQEAYNAGYYRALNEQAPVDFDWTIPNINDWNRHGSDPLHPHYKRNQRYQQNKKVWQYRQWLEDGTINQETYDKLIGNG